MSSDLLVSINCFSGLVSYLAGESVTRINPPRGSTVSLRALVTSRSGSDEFTEPRGTEPAD